MPSDDPGSFRDPASRVVHDDGRVLRLLDQRGAKSWKALSQTSFFDAAVREGRLIETTQLDDIVPGATAVLEHPRLPFISYPYEWTFGMLKDAALLQLQLLLDALDEGLTIKDATPYNVQFVAGRPVFIDIGSFEEYHAGEAWIGYRQFTRQFLFPLLLRSWLGIPFQPWLRGAMDGPTAAEMASLLPLRHRLRPTALLHVSLQARMERTLSGSDTRRQLKSAGFGADLIKSNVRRLQKLVGALEPSGLDAAWSTYDECLHVTRDRDAKTSFLEEALAVHEPRRVLDLGANDAHFSEVAASSGALAIAVDGDEAVLEKVYRSSARVSLVVSDLTNPSPSQGWAGSERPGLFDRARPDLVVAYGVIHHLIYSASVPPSEVVAWLASFSCPVVVEFVAPDDEMVSVLTANKLEAELHEHRTRAEFEDLLDHRFEVTATRELEGGTRHLYALAPRDGLR